MIVAIAQKYSFLKVPEQINHSTVVLVVPGGGYDHLSKREAEPVARKFESFGYDSAILHYSVGKIKNFEPEKEINEAVLYLKSLYKHIFLCGFSAGGHLVGLAATGKNASLIDGVIYCYPVITFLGPTHEGTKNHLLGLKASKELCVKYSIEKRISTTTPPSFVWACESDQSVPVSNSIALVEALKENHVIVESLFFDHGIHGMALADETAIKDGNEAYVDKEIATWVDHAHDFIEKVVSK